jgi:hypothetical protein
MLSQTNENLRQLFIKNFTAELILNSKKVVNLNELKEKNNEEIEIKKRLKEIITRSTEEKIRKPVIQEQKVSIPQQTQIKPLNKILPEVPISEKIGETTSTFNSVKSAILASGEIDFGKIAQFIKDPAISLIECKRADEKINIKKIGQVISTEVSLSGEEINAIIKAFSEKTRIPIVEGILKARWQNLEMFAVISQFSTSRFIITKFQPTNLSINPTGMPNTNRLLISQNPFAPKNPALSLLKK